jgi:DNA primase large subunit
LPVSVPRSAPAGVTRRSDGDAILTAYIHHWHCGSLQLPFAQALELIRHRKVYLRRGYAYVPKSELVTIVCGSFRAALSEALVVCMHSPV